MKRRRIRSKNLRILRERLHYAQMQVCQDLAGYRRSIENVKAIAARMRAIQAAPRKPGRRSA